MVFRKLLKEFAAFFSPREPPQVTVQEPKWQGASPFEKLESKVAFWKTQATHAALPHALETKEPIGRLIADNENIGTFKSRFPSWPMFLYF